MGNPHNLDYSVKYSIRVEDWQIYRWSDGFREYAPTKKRAKKKARRGAKGLAQRESRKVRLGIYKKSDGELQKVEEYE